MQLKAKLKKTEELIGHAKGLLDKLGGEKDRWGQQVQQIIRKNKMLPLNTLLAAAFTNYLSDKDENIREKSLNEWVQLAKQSKYSYLKFMIQESKIL